MATQRSADILLGAFQDEMVTRRKFDVKNSKDEVIMSLYFKPITRYARVKAQQLAGPADALVISTQLLCQMAEKEDGTPAFDMSDAPILQRQLPEKVLNELELFLNEIQA
ncbi:MAG: hypothetical protein CM15mV115_190 [Caudoviricetes sp.]|nr:MAG: hypothetical protein CM15mV115_190 [Caudoviricetes sp.]